MDLNIPELIKTASFYERQGKLDEALNIYCRAIELNPNPKICLNLAKHIQARKQNKINLLQLLKQHKNKTFYLNLGRAFDRLKEYNAAITCYRQAIKLQPNLIEDLLPIIYSNNIKQEKFQAATQTYEEWLKNYYLIDRQHKIIYCPIPKNACTLLKKILITHSEHKAHFWRSGLDVHRYIRQNRNRVCLQDISYLKNPEYLKIATIRNPLERLVSAYLNKIARPKKTSPIVKNIIKEIYCDRQLKPDYQKSITFEDFINYLSTTEDAYLNEHWRSQTSFLGRELFQFDLLITMENISQLIEQLEVRIGIKIPKQKTTNKTNYGNLSDRIPWHQIYPQQLRSQIQLPTAKLLCNQKLKATIQNRYFQDFQIYYDLKNNLIT